MGAIPMSETQHSEPGVKAERPAYTLASPEFFHLLQKIDQAEAVLRGEIKQSEAALRGEIAGLRGWVIATLATVALSTIGLALYR
jgi:hypothetical protein